MAEAEEVAPELKPIQERLHELAALKEERQDLLEYVATRYDDETRAIAEKAKAIEKLKGEITDLEQKLREDGAFDDLDSVDDEIATVERLLRNACYGLPINMLRDGQRVSVPGMKIVVSKTRVKREYLAEDLLRDFPDLRKESVDGDSVVYEAINGPVLDRLLADKKYDPEELKPYIIETKLKNPSVRIRESSDEAE